MSEADHVTGGQIGDLFKPIPLLADLAEYPGWKARMRMACRGAGWGDPSSAGFPQGINDSGEALAGEFRGHEHRSNNGPSRGLSSSSASTSGSAGYTCWLCNKKGHRKFECPENKRSDNKRPKEDTDSTDASATFAGSDSFGASLYLTSSGDRFRAGNVWILDSGASRHMVGQDIFVVNRRTIPEMNIRIADNGRMLASECADVPVIVSHSDEKLILRDVLVVPQLHVNLLSFRCLLGNPGVVIESSCDRLLVRRNGRDLFVANWCASTRAYVVIFESPEEAARISYCDTKQDLQMWHDRLGHSGMRVLTGTLKDNNIKFNSGKVSMCNGCVQGRMVRQPFPSPIFDREESAKKVGDVVHSDVCGPITNSLGNKSYFVSYIDEYSGLAIVYVISQKKDVTSTLPSLVQSYQMRGHKILRIHSDNGREYFKPFTKRCRELGIDHTSTIPYCPQQNGRAERWNRTVLEKTMSMLYHAQMPVRFWAEALMTATYVYNNMIREAAGKTPWTMFSGRRSSIRHCRVWGCEAWKHVPKEKRSKLDPKAIRCVLVGYATQQRGYRLFDLQTKKIVVARDVVFDESKFPLQAVNAQMEVKRITTSFISPSVGCVGPDNIPMQEQGRCNEHAVCDVEDVNNNADEPECSDDEEEEDDDHDDDEVEEIDDSDVDISGVHENQLNIRNDLMNEESEQPETRRMRTQTKRFRAGRDNSIVSSESVAGTAEERDHTEDHHMDEYAIRLLEQSDSDISDADGADLELLHEEESNEESAQLAKRLMDNCPRNYTQARKSPESSKWDEAMSHEAKSIWDHQVFRVVDRPPNTKVIDSRWVYTKKTDEFGNVVRYKARFVAKGFQQTFLDQARETYSPVIELAIVRLLLVISMMYNMVVHQMDVRTAFLNGTLSHPVYVEIAPGLGVDVDRTKVLEVSKALYGLQESPRQWYLKLRDVLLQLGFRRCAAECCMFVRGRDMASKVIVVIYVDDLLVISASNVEVESVKTGLKNHFSMKDLGLIKYYLGIAITSSENRMALTQTAYIQSILDRFGMSGCNSVSTPLPAKLELSKKMGPTTETEKLEMKNVPYREAVGCLNFLSQTTRPDICFAVGLVSRFLNNPGKRHWQAVKHIFRYLKGTMHFGLKYTVPKRDNKLGLTVYSDADFAGDIDQRRSTSGFAVYLNGNLIGWKSRKQVLTAVSTTEAEYIGLFEASKVVAFLEQVIDELKLPDSVIRSKCVLYGDNQPSIANANNADHTGRTKHLDIRHHFVRDQVELGRLVVQYCRSENMIADIFTKSLGKTKFHRFRKALVEQNDDADQTISTSVGE